MDYLSTPSGNAILIALGFIWIVIVASRNNGGHADHNTSINVAQSPPPTPDSKPEVRTETTQIMAAQPEPNFICRNRVFISAHLEHGDIVEGHEDQRPSRPYSRLDDGTNMGLVAVEICNEFSASRKVVAAEYITAEIVYRPSIGRAIQVNRGAWLSRGNRVNSFQVNDLHRLIIAGAFAAEASNTFIINRAFDEHEDFEMLTTPLEDNLYRVEVSLISEARGKLFQKFAFDLSITRDPHLDIELIEIQPLPAKEICEQLETFLFEGNKVLKSFPTDREKTSADDEKIDHWERRVVKFIASQNPESLSVAVFLSDFPMVQRPGLAHASNWNSLNRLTTRLARLKDAIDVLRKRLNAPI